MTAPARGSVSPAVLLLAVAGAVFTYSALKNKSISNSVRALLSGENPSAAPSQASIVPVTDSTGFNLVTSSSTGGASQQAFYSDVLRGIGAPITQGNLNALAGVTQTEGVNGYNNPFNIEWHPGEDTSWKGVANYNDVGVQEYATYQQGVNATIAFLKSNSHWSNVIAAAKTGSQSMLEGALTSAYTWTKFKLAGSNAGSLLSAPVSG